MSATAHTMRPLSPSWRSWRPIVGIALVGAIAVASLAAAHAESRTLGLVAFGAVALPALAYAVLRVEPVWLLSGALALTMFSGSWRHIGLPNLVSPDRLVLVAAVVAFFLREPALGERRRLQLGFTHLVIALAAVFAIGSAIAVDTLTHRSTLYVLIDRHGLAPFVLFTLAPAVFATARDRRILLGTLVAMGAYLGFTSLAEGLSARALVWPRYILDPSFGYQVGRARGPFAESSINGLALYGSVVACGVALATWRDPRWRRVAAVVGLGCLFAIIFTLQRSVWLGAIIATLVAMGAAPRLRRWLPGTVVAGAIIVVGALIVVPGLRENATQRLNDQRTVWDRRNLNDAAEHMFLDRPLFGFGWGTFQQRSADHFQLSPDYPITNPTGMAHNVFLSNLAELGLVGTTLWALALALAIGGAILRRGPPELAPWRTGLLALAIIWLVVALLTPLVQPLPNHLLWLWAGLLWRPGGQADQPSAE